MCPYAHTHTHVEALIDVQIDRHKHKDIGTKSNTQTRDMQEECVNVLVRSTSSGRIYKREKHLSIYILYGEKEGMQYKYRILPARQPPYQATCPQLLECLEPCTSISSTLLIFIKIASVYRFILFIYLHVDM